FNTLTEADVYAADQLFATLDPTMRRIDLDEVGPAILADTVGFISHLPHKLVEAFRATLEEAASANLLLHVVDASAPDRFLHIQRVNDVLEEIGAGDLPVLLIYNKIDLLDGMTPRIDRDARDKPVAVWLSAAQSGGIQLLTQAVKELVADDFVEGAFVLLPNMAKLRAMLYEANGVQSEQTTESGESILTVRLQRTVFNRTLKQAGMSVSDIQRLDVGADATKIA
ncbi:MAG: GTPase, partial [bacterium]